MYLKKAFSLHASFLALPPPEGLSSNTLSLVFLYFMAVSIGMVCSVIAELFSAMVGGGGGAVGGGDTQLCFDEGGGGERNTVLNAELFSTTAHSRQYGGGGGGNTDEEV